MVRSSMRGTRPGDDRMACDSVQYAILWRMKAFLQFTARLAVATIGVLFSGSVCMAAGNVVDLTYDPAGNITQIRRQSATGLAVTGFDPANGAVGSVVTVFGTGFGTTPASNTVRFNGIAAAVSAADSGSLSVTVPAGTTTGRISVTVGAAAAVSAQDFQVVVPGAPVVTAFSPAIASPNEAVTVSGSNFAPPGSVTLKLNMTPASLGVQGPSSLTFSVPPATGSGRIAVTNPTGTGTSVPDLIVPPTGYLGSDIATAIRLAGDGTPSSFQIGAASKYGVLLFDGLLDGYYTIQFGQLTFSPSTATLAYTVFKPDNTQFTSGYVGYGYRPTIHLPKLPAAGTYSVFISPGIATMASQVSVAADPLMTLDGPVTNVAMGSPSQTTRTLFDATAAQPIGVGISGYTQNASTTSSSYFNVYQPNGTALGGSASFNAYWSWSSNPAGNWDGEFIAPATGRYEMIAQPVTGYAASYGASISSALTATLSPDLPVDFTLARVGQDGRFTFPASPGDSRAIDLAVVSPQPVAQSVAYRVLKPDGTLFASGSTSPPLNGSQVQLPAFPVAGNYIVEVDPSYGTYGAMRIALKQGALLGTADPPLAFTTAVNGETARFRFQGTAGQNVSLGISALAYIGTSSSQASLTVFEPDGTSLTYTSCNPNAVGGLCRLGLPNLPATGTYVVTLQPPAGVRASGSITFSADQAGSLAEGIPASVAITRTGQFLRYTFAGTAGQSTSVELAQLVTSPSGPYVYVNIYKPDGNSLTSGSASSGGVFINLPSLPATGTYTVVVDPSGAGLAGRLSLKAGTATAVGSAPVALSTAVTGEVIRITFAGTSGSRLELGLNGLAYDAASATSTSLNVYRPDGTSIAGGSCSTSTPGGGCEIAMPSSLPSTGTYSIVLFPPAGRRIVSGSLAVSTFAPGTFVVGDPSQVVAIARPGQTARYTFAGAAGQLLRLGWSGASVSVTNANSIAVSVLKPDGSTLVTSSFGNGGTGSVDIPSLPAAGSYTVVFDPSYAATMSASVNLVTR